MNSSTSRTLEKQKEQDEIKRQIELLKAQLIESEPRSEPEAACDVKEGKKEKLKVDKTLKKRDGKVLEEGGGGVMLAPNTPSPRKKRKVSHLHPSSSSSIPKPSFHSRLIAKSSSSSTKCLPTSTLPNAPTIPSQFSTPQPSTLFSSLRRLEKATAGEEEDDDGSNERKEQGERTVGFEDKPRQRRDERLALVEDFEMGPYEFTPPVGDPTFKAFEPHSNIALSSRILPHTDLSDYLVGRFYISPSRLYSLLRVDTSCTDTKGKKGGYDLEVPVPGDWVTIAVIAERGPIKYTKAPVGVDKDEEDVKGKKKWEGKGKKDKAAPAEDEGGGRGGGKKYVTLKMIDFGQTSGGGGYKQIRGDAFLNLILFEADGFDLIARENDGRRRGRGDEKVYRGGSGGAFEKLMDVREGDVVALLNPRVLRPFQRTNASPQTPILAVTPPSASSIVIIGRSRDLGMCTVLKADGKVCGAWCDKRAVTGKEGKASVCEYHLERAVMRRRAGRNEFAIGTSGMTTSATHKRKHDHDPLRKWGLKPLNEGAAASSSASAGSGSGSGGALGATYVFAGHVVSNHNVAASSMFVGEKVGREAQARAKRKMGDGKVKEGEEVLVSRMVGKTRGKSRTVSAKGKGKRDDEDDEDESWSDGAGKEKKNKPLYSAGFIKSLGFDPSQKGGIGIVGGGGSGVNKSVQDKLDALHALQRSRTKEIELGPRRGRPRIRSGVVAPPCASGSGTGTTIDVGEEEKSEGGGGDEKMVDLDDDT